MADPNVSRSPEPVRVPAFTRVLEPALWAGLLAATLAALVLVVRSDLLPQQRPLTHALVFWLWFLAVAVPVGAAAAALAWTIARLARTRWLAWLPEAVPRVAALVVVAVLLLENRRPVRLVLAGLDGPARHRVGLALALVAATVTLAVLAVPPPRWRAWARTGGALTVVAFLVASFPPAVRHRLPGSASIALPAAAHRPPQRFLLFGIDGADWRYIDELVARGDLPNLAALRERGAWGPLGTIARSSSPIIWNTIATGQPPEVHGIDGFTVYFHRGMTDPLPARVIGPKGVGFRRLRDWLEDRGFLYQVPIASSARQVPAYWNVATRLGSPVAVLNWWATWPAEPVLGSMVSERMYFWRFAARGTWSPAERLVWPEHLGPRLAPLVMRPEEVGWAEARPFLDLTREEYEAMVAPSRGKTAQGEFRYLYSMFETNRRLAFALLEHGRAQAAVAPDALVLDRTVDIACHAGLRESELVPPHPGSTDGARRRFGRLVSEAYRSVDRALGEVMAAFGEGNVVVVSDHGFVLMGDPRDRHSYYHHTDGPEGIFVAAGPAFRPGRVEGLTVYDVMPMLLHLKGFPVASDLAGQVPLQVFTDALRAEPPATIATYGGREEAAAVPGARAVDDEAIERLRALGYVK